ncbi:MAG: hypothetical protein LJE68_12290 [Rhodobacter sp.]|jgi:hypothetical protein|nr:hypothetical protein [Rhodobacter sp.]
MKPIDNRDFELPETLSARGKFKSIRYVGALLSSIIWPFGPRPDLNRLNTRLLRDAGLDEHELERARLARAPLIR